MGFEHRITLVESTISFKDDILNAIKLYNSFVRVKATDSSISGWFHEHPMEDCEVEVNDDFIYVCFYGGVKTQRDLLLTFLTDILDGLGFEFSVEEI